MELRGDWKHRIDFRMTKITKWRAMLRGDAATSAALFVLVFAPGFLFFFNDVGIVSDDFSGFRHVIGEDKFKKIFEPLFSWLQGRPLGHFVWRLQHFLFSPFPLGVFQLWCGFLLILQAVLAFKILLKLRIAKAPAIIAASVIGLAPFAQSSYLPVHAALTEFATTLFLLSILFVFAKKPVLAGVTLAVSPLFYEHMAPLFWIPLLIFLWKGWVNRSIEKPFFRISSHWPLIRFAITLLFVAFTILIVRIYAVSGREAELVDFSHGELAYRAYNAGVVGMRTSFRIFSWAQRFNLSVGAETLPLALFLSTFAGFAVFLVFQKDMADAKQMNIFAALALVALGVFIAWASHIIFITPERYPPGIMTGRLTNTHSGARLGAGLAFAAMMQVFVGSPTKTIRIIGIVGSITLLNWMVLYSHSYGAAAASVWKKKVQMGLSHGIACQYLPTFKNSILILPKGFMQTHTDPVVDWTTHLTPTLFFKNSGSTRFYIVTDEHAESFLEQMYSDNPTFELSGLTGAGYAWVIGKNPSNLRPVRAESVVLSFAADGEIVPIFPPLGSETDKECALEPRKRFKNTELVPKFSASKNNIR